MLAQVALSGLLALPFPALPWDAATELQESPSIHWESDFGQARRRASDEALPLMAVFAAVWCPACREFQRDVLPDERVNSLADDFVWLRLDLDREVELARRFGDRWYAYGSYGWTRHGLDRWRGLALVKEQSSQLIALEYRYAPRAAWVLQYLRTDAVSEDLAPFDRAPPPSSRSRRGAPRSRDRPRPVPVARARTATRARA